MQRQWSTAVSDFMLALSGLWGFREVAVAVAAQGEGEGPDHRFAKWWLMLVTLAAALGTIRFGGLMPNNQSAVERYHRNFSWLTRAIGIPCLAAEVCTLTGYPFASQGFLLSALGTFVASGLRSRHKEHMTNLVATLAVLAVIGLAFTTQREVLGAGGLLLATGGLAGGEEGRWLGILRVDIFHYCLATANVCLTKGIIG